MAQLTEIAADALDAMTHVEAFDDARFDELALRVYAAQRAAIPAYDAWCAHELGTRTSATVGTWRDVPALPIEAFKQLEVAEAGAPVAASWLSSGTTADERSTHRLQDIALYDRSLDAGVAAALVPDVVAGELAPIACVQLQPGTSAAPQSSLSHMFDRIRTGPWCSDEGTFVHADFTVHGELAWSRLEALAADGRPVLVLATSFALALLLEHASEIGWERLHLPAGSRVVDTGGYKGRTRELTREQLLEQVEHWLGVSPAWSENEYGMSELSSQAWLGTIAAATGHPLELPAPGARWTPPWLRVRVVDPVTLEEVADGEAGLLVFHDLANAWSCATIRSEDLGIRRGAGYELVGRAPGATLKGCSLRLEELAAG
jgi:hypothetical protein